jgi:hypothetical protein
LLERIVRSSTFFMTKLRVYLRNLQHGFVNVEDWPLVADVTCRFI